MSIEEALELLQSFLFAQTYQHLNNLQIAVLRGVWNNQTYEQIAQTHCVSYSHAKAVGAQLWDVLSSVLAAKVNKKNFRVVLERKAREWQLADELMDVGEPLSFPPKSLSCTNTISTLNTIATPTVELPGGQVPLDSPFYVERPPVEARCYDTILQPGALIRIHAPRQWGKTSLMARILEQARWQGYRTVTLNLQLANSQIFSSLDRFLQWFCASVGKSLGLPNHVADCWDEILGSNSSGTDYFENYLLAEIDTPVVLGLDDLDIIFQYPDITLNFLGLLRTWHEKAKYGNHYSSIWKKLRFVIVHYMNVDMLSNINHSAFNIGLSIELSTFCSKQVQDLARRHRLNWSANQVEQLMSLVGGHPYLIRKALYHIWQQDVTLEQLLLKYAKKGKIYDQHLRQQLTNLHQYPNLYQAFTYVVSSPTAVEIDWGLALQLHSMGLVHLRENQVIPSCNLYRQYFSSVQGNAVQYN